MKTKQTLLPDPRGVTLAVDVQCFGKVFHTRFRQPFDCPCPIYFNKITAGGKSELFAYSVCLWQVGRIVDAFTENGLSRCFDYLPMFITGQFFSRNRAFAIRRNQKLDTA